MAIHLEVAADRCKACELCVEACPRGVLAMEGTINALGYKSVKAVAPERCTGCTACYLVCPEVVFAIAKSA